MMDARWDYGEAVRLTRNVRNDGTYPGLDPGAFLVRRGSIGYVVDVGTFLQDQIIYTVFFYEENRIVGCREEELIDIDEPWVPSLYFSRERVAAGQVLAMGGETKIPKGSVGEILRVLRDGDAPVYHVHFDCLPGRVFAVPETALSALNSLGERQHA